MRYLTPGHRPPWPSPASLSWRLSLALLILSLLAGALTSGDPARALAEDEPASVAATQSMPAFPGAEGYGALTPGGRGGKVIAVTSLEDSGPGSLRAALESGGRRTVVFHVGGVIRLLKAINIRQPFLTIAGQSAPGDGIVLRGAGIRVRTHDVIIRGLRFRVGDDPEGEPPITRDGITILGPDSDGNPARNIIVDHCSVSWAIDENTSVYQSENVSIQWSLISEGLNNSIHDEPHHSNALLLAEQARRISVHHNLLAHHWYRNPLVKGNTEVEFVDNIVYNWGASATLFEDGSHAGPTRSIVARNLYRRGPSTESETSIRIHKSVATGSEIFLAENTGDHKLSADMPVLAGGAPLAAPPVPVSASLPASVYHTVLAAAGASSPARDPIDLRVIAEARAGTGRIIDKVSEVGGWEILDRWDAGSAPADADQDGMPDSWELERGLNPAHAADAVALAPTNYTWIEEYLNSLVPSGLTTHVFLPAISR